MGWVEREVWGARNVSGLINPVPALGKGFVFFGIRRFQGSVMDPTLGGSVPGQGMSFPWMGREKAGSEEWGNREISKQLGQGDPSTPKKQGLGANIPQG